MSKMIQCDHCDSLIKDESLNSSNWFRMERFSPKTGQLRYLHFCQPSCVTLYFAKEAGMRVDVVN